MPIDWIYPVNDSSSSWGYDQALPDFMKNANRAPHLWTTRRRFKDFNTGDRIWVRATQPLGVVVGVGEVLSTLLPGDTATDWYFKVSFDNAVTTSLSSNPYDLQLDSVPQSMRRLSPDELARLRRRIGKKTIDEIEGQRGKRRRMTEVAVREGQADFRQRLFRAYGSRCAISGCAVEKALDAAHIEVYDGPVTSVVTNGLLLRADLHRLFDEGLIWITESMRIGLSPDLTESEYSSYRGKKLRLPPALADRPSIKALAIHRTTIAQQQG